MNPINQINLCSKDELKLIAKTFSKTNNKQEVQLFNYSKNKLSKLMPQSDFTRFFKSL